MTGENCRAHLVSLKTGGVARVGDPLKSLEHQYTAHMHVVWDTNEMDLMINVGTNEGWDAAKGLAFDRLKSFAEALAKSAEHERSGPHVPKL